MITSRPPWRPHVGECVSIKGKNLTGTVHQINGHGEDRRYVIPGVQVNHTVYWLEELEEIEPIK